MVYIRVENRRKTIVGVTGKKGHGKDTFAQELCKPGRRRLAGVILHFADALKEIASAVFEIDMASFTDRELKEKEFQSPVVIDLFLPKLNTVTGLTLSPLGKIARTPRELLQLVGSDYVRECCPTFCFDTLLDKIAKSKHNVIAVADVRFPNEAEALRRIGAKLVKITRIDIPDSNDTHQSELGVDLIIPDVNLGVRTGDLSIIQIVASILKSPRGTYISAYDYSNIAKISEGLASGQSAAQLSSILGVPYEDNGHIRFLLSYYGLRSSKNAVYKYNHTFRDGIEGKPCSGCKLWNPLASFSVASRSRDGLGYYCKECSVSRAQRTYVKEQETLTYLQSSARVVIPK